jgi:hypothetical protein
MSGGRLSRKQKESRLLGGYTWFPFDVIDWLTNDDVARMTAAEEGVYIRLLAVQWRDGYLPSSMQILSKACGRRADLLTRWFAKWSHLFPVSDGNPSHLRNPKLHEIAVVVAESDLVRHAEEKRREQRTPDEEESTPLIGEEVVDSAPAPQTKVEPKVSVQKTKEPKPEKTPAQKLANRFWIRIGKLSRYSDPVTVELWTALANRLLKTDDFDTIASVIDWALDVSAFWTDKIVGATTIGPFDYFVEKYEDIKQKMGAEKKSLENAKNKAAKTKAAVSSAGKPTYQQADQKSWVSEDMGKEPLK